VYSVGQQTPFHAIVIDTTNTIFQLAVNLVNHTGQPIFLTGKAGTGKTTFLKYIKEHTQKSAVVVAPTGVAAINAGGVTMHSFFQLPFGPFIPHTAKGFTGNGNTVTDKHALFSNIRFNSDKRDLINELELLIIDEVSMVRADMLDAIDLILRHFRKKPFLPFGGVQTLYIGDLFQLPPVMPDAEWEILKQYYKSPFFFDAKVIEEAYPLYVELNKIYRQNDTLFIDVLNRVRNNAVTNEDLHLLNAKYQPSFQVPNTEKYITLSTHNKKADIINAQQLQKLSTPAHKFVGIITKDFSEKALPTDLELQLKEGAQVMFIKNDTAIERRFYNGKLAMIKSIKGNEIMVAFDTGEPDLKLEKEKWQNIRYQYNQEKESIEEEEIGSFEQYPVRLAWAITIHKSQGLTFTKAIIDAGASFAPGQVYVALSRCTNLPGIVLYSVINASAINTDGRVIAFAEKSASENLLQEILDKEKRKYWAENLLKAFDWGKIITSFFQWKEQVPTKKLPDTGTAIAIAKKLYQQAQEQYKVAVSFQEKLKILLLEDTETVNLPLLQERVTKAIAWFSKALAEELLKPLQVHIQSFQYAIKTKQYLAELQTVQAVTWQKLLKIQQVTYGDIVFWKEENPYKFFAPNTTPKQAYKNKKSQPEKGSSQRLSLSLFEEGKSIEAIAQLRGLAASTIGGHLADFVKTGELDVHRLVAADKIPAILKVILEDVSATSGTIKEKLGDAYTYADIKAVMHHHQYLQLKAIEAK
jgi:hypothetical protein